VGIPDHDSVFAFQKVAGQKVAGQRVTGNSNAALPETAKLRLVSLPETAAKCLHFRGKSMDNGSGIKPESRI
jgi:hypothetical protein